MVSVFPTHSNRRLEPLYGENRQQPRANNRFSPDYQRPTYPARILLLIGYNSFLGDPMVIRNLLTMLAGCVLLVLAFIGFLVPILPGFLFFILALFCFAAVSPRLQRRLERNPTLHAWQTTWRRGSGLPLGHRIRLMFWMAAESAVRAMR